MAAVGMGQKRSRSDLEEDCDDCLPISKRINRLHIKPTRQNLEDDASKQGHCGECSSQTDGNQTRDIHWSVNSTPCQPGQVNGQQISVASYSRVENNNNSLPDCRPNMQVAGDSMEEVTVYDPELDESANPYYFHSNQLLFDAHLSRTTRTKSFPHS